MEDIDWRRGEITVRGKGDRHERLPLPADVGEAVVAYLSGFRPAATPGREVFLGTRAPHRALTRGAVTQVVARASHRCGLGTIYAHRLRHTAATTMLHAGRVAGGDRAGAAPPARAVHRRLREGRPPTAARAGPALAR